MSDRRVERTERHRDEGVYSARVQEDKKEQQKFTHLPENDKKILLATFFSYLKKMFDTFSPSKKFAGKIVDQQSIVENLQKLKNLLEKLGKKNLSASSDFAIQLSDLWICIVDDFDNIEILERKNLQEVASFREMMDQIKNFPPDSEHRFGYYLLEHAGKDWLPFPFIEILEKLHKEHVTDSKTSNLTSWLKKIDGVITNLKSTLPFNL